MSRNRSNLIDRTALVALVHPTLGHYWVDVQAWNVVDAATQAKLRIIGEAQEERDRSGHATVPEWRDLQVLSVAMQDGDAWSPWTLYSLDLLDLKRPNDLHSCLHTCRVGFAMRGV